MKREDNTSDILKFKLEVARLVVRQLFVDNPRLKGVEFQDHLLKRLLEYGVAEAEVRSADAETMRRMAEEITAQVKSDLGAAQEKPERWRDFGPPLEERDPTEALWDSIEPHLPEHLRNPVFAGQLGWLLGGLAGKAGYRAIKAMLGW